jgi:hypothetical protein
MPDGNYSFSINMTANDPSQTSALQSFTIMLGSDPSSGGGDTGGCGDTATITLDMSF